MDATHKATRKLISENQTACVESLSVKNMIKHPTLAKHIADALLGRIRSSVEVQGAMGR
jgi:putative transposase